MDNLSVMSFQKSPAEGTYACINCNQVLNLKQGQLVPPCPRCGGREFKKTEGVCC